MGVNSLAALAIQENETVVSVYGPDSSGKWGFMISYDDGGRRKSFAPDESLYDTCGDALREGREFRKGALNMDLSEYRKEMWGNAGGL